jgi:drug/metabolite transporter (DMT)-like permease
MKQWCITGSARRNGIIYALVAAVLFGASTPVAKMLLGSFSPFLLAAVLYLGSAGGLFGWRLISKLFNRKPSTEAKLRRSEYGWLAAAIFSGGLVGPILLFFGLKLLPASTTSLLLNLEGVFTAALAWLVFKEGVDRRLLVGMGAITGGGILLAVNGTTSNGASEADLLVIGACLAWAVDNNLTRKVSAGDPVQIAMLKGMTAGTFSLLLAVWAGCQMPSLSKLAAAALVGLFGYGVSLSCFVLALREIGAARAGAYFSCAPFFGAFLAICLLREPVPLNFLAAATLMGIGVYLHLTEEHQHEHSHPDFEHEHSHVHDEHHQHEHAGDQPQNVPHSHWHRHEPTVHSHSHFPDLHHLHDH